MKEMTFDPGSSRCESDAAGEYSVGKTPCLSRLRAKVQGFRESTNGRILAAAFTVAAMTTLVKLTSLVKDIMVAHRFGTGEALDAFYVAMLIPTFLMGIFGESFNAALIPIYVEVRGTEGKEAAQRLLSGVAGFSLAVLSAIALLPLVFRERLLLLLGSGFGPQKLAISELLILPLLGLLPLCGLSTLWRAALTVDDGFAVSSLAPIMRPAMIILMVVALSSRWGIYAVAGGTVLGAAGDLAICGQALWRRGVSLWPRWHGIAPPLRRVLLQYGPMVAGALLMGSTTLVDQSMAAMLTSGSVSALNYANKVLTLPMTIGVYAMSVAVLPSFSELSARRDWAEMRQVLSTYTRLIFLVSVPLTLLLIKFSEPLVAIIFEGGAFTREDVRLVAQVQALLALQVPFYAVGILYVRAISAVKRNQILMWGTMISVVVNATLNVVFMRIMGLPGIALSTSVVYVISCCYLRFMLFRVLCQHEAEKVNVSYEISSDSVA